MNSVLKKYLIYNFVKIFFNVLLVFLSLGIILNLFEEIEFFKNLDLGLSLPFLLTLLSVPNHVMQLTPFIIFIATMWLLVHLKSSGELHTLKIFGFSNFKIVGILSITAFFVGFILLIFINPLTAIMIKHYESIKANYSRDVDHLVSINKNGLWIKEMNNQKFRIVTAKTFASGNIYDVSIYNLDKENRIIDRIETKKVDISKNVWKIQKGNIYKLDEFESLKMSAIDDYQIISSFNYEKINTLYRNLDSIPFHELILNYEELKNKGYSNEILLRNLNTLISLPIFLFLMVFLASNFVLGSNSYKKQNTKYIFLSIFICVFVYYFKDLSIALGKSNKIPLILSVWMPILTLSILCSIGMIQINEK